MRKINAKKLNNSIHAMMQTDIEEANIAGAAAIVSQNGEVLCEARLGYSDIEEKKPLSPRALFRFASFTKPITAVAALIGVQQGLFSLDDPIEKYYPEFEDMQIGKMENGQVVPDKKSENTLKIYHLLSHSSGLVCGDVGCIQMYAFPEELP